MKEPKQKKTDQEALPNAACSHGIGDVNKAGSVFSSASWEDRRSHGQKALPNAACSHGI